MWSYYGAKTNVIDLYPKPKHDKIIEPFAGTARYALKYFDREVLLIDKYDVMIRIWEWLQQCSPGDILRYQREWKVGDRLENISIDCDEAKMLLGFLITTAEKPRHQVTSWIGDPNRDRINHSLRRIAGELFKIKHWKFIHGSYEDVPNEKATWFIDPPYQIGGHSYVHNNKKIDYNRRGDWAANRQGQSIVCEQLGATWMDFKIFCQHKTRRKTKMTEVIWCNERTVFDNVQTKLIL